MRQGQNNKRSRGRPNNRKSQSGRTFDSNGPDVKIRGTAAHIYEKYQSLARDAQASGDRIVAENYLQHAEHYYRVMLAADGAAALQNRMGMNQPRPPMQNNVNGQASDSDDGDEAYSGGGANAQPNHAGEGQSQPAEAAEHRGNGQSAGNGHSNGNGRSSPPHVEEVLVAKPNGADTEGAAESASSEREGDGERAAASGNGREAPRRRGRPSRERESEAPAPAAEAESDTGSETSESAN